MSTGLPAGLNSLVHKLLKNNTNQVSIQRLVFVGNNFRELLFSIHIIFEFNAHIFYMFIYELSTVNLNTCTIRLSLMSYIVKVQPLVYNTLPTQSTYVLQPRVRPSTHTKQHYRIQLNHTVASTGVLAMPEQNICSINWKCVCVCL